jgi:hypothetical protein
MSYRRRRLTAAASNGALPMDFLSETSQIVSSVLTYGSNVRSFIKVWKSSFRETWQKTTRAERHTTHDDDVSFRPTTDEPTDVIGDEQHDASTSASPGGARGGATNDDDDEWFFFENLIVAESEREGVRRGPERAAESSVPVERSDEPE